MLASLDIIRLQINRRTAIRKGRFKCSHKNIVLQALWHHDVVPQFSNFLLAATLTAKEPSLGSLVCERDEGKVTLARGLGTRTELGPLISINLILLIV